MPNIFTIFHTFLYFIALIFGVLFIFGTGTILMATGNGFADVTRQLLRLNSQMAPTFTGERANSGEIGHSFEANPVNGGDECRPELLWQMGWTGECNNVEVLAATQWCL